MFRRLGFLFRISRAHGIARRYFVTNGFDGALTMLGLTAGFYTGNDVAIPVVISACLGAAIALGMSGLSSAYISEVAEKEKELRDLEQAMIQDLEDTDHGRASRYVPVLIAFVNGAAPFFVSLFIISPLWLSQAQVEMPLGPLEMSMALAFVAIFTLGAFLGRISDTFWIWAGLRALFIGLATAAIIFVYNQREVILMG